MIRLLLICVIGAHITQTADVHTNERQKDNQDIIDDARDTAPYNHRLFALFKVRNSRRIALYKGYPGRWELSWILRTKWDNGERTIHFPVLKVYQCVIGDEKSYNFFWDNVNLSLPNPSSHFQPELVINHFKDFSEDEIKKNSNLDLYDMAQIVRDPRPLTLLYRGDLKK